MKSDKTHVKAEVILDRIEEDQAVLLAGEKEIILPKDLLPADLKDGEVLSLTIQTKQEETLNREKTAKELLNEILNIKS